MHSSKEDHLKVVYMVLTVLKYLKISSEKDFSSVKQERKIEVFYDVEWVRLINDMRSTNKYSTFVWENLVTWISKNQNVVSKSSAKAEFRTIVQGICEGYWLKKLPEELQDESSSTQNLMW